MGAFPSDPQRRLSIVFEDKEAEKLELKLDGQYTAAVDLVLHQSEVKTTSTWRGQRPTY